MSKELLLTLGTILFMFGGSFLFVYLVEGNYKKILSILKIFNSHDKRRKK